MAITGERGLDSLDFNIGNFKITSTDDFVIRKEQKKGISNMVSEFGCYIYLLRVDKAVYLFIIIGEHIYNWIIQ